MYPEIKLNESKTKTNMCQQKNNFTMAGLATFKRGYVWRVGNGDKINICQDSWITSSPNRKILTPRGAALYIKVSDIVNPEKWDIDILQALLSPVDVHRALQILLHNRGFEDLFASSFTKHGRYSVRSGYHVQWRHQFGASARQLALPGSSGIGVESLEVYAAAQDS
jgi:hypothetical protein